MGLAFFLFQESTPQSFAFDQPSKLNQLALYMESRYRRELHKDDFSFNYVPRPPNTIFVQIKYYPHASQQTISILIQSARELINSVGKEKFDLNRIDIKVEMQMIEPPSDESKMTTLEWLKYKYNKFIENWNKK